MSAKAPSMFDVCMQCTAKFVRKRHRRPSRFCSVACRNRHTSVRRKNARGFVISSRGYKLLRMPAHPRAHRNGYIMEHRVVMEAMLGRPLLSTEIVHHRNGNRRDNRPDNLQVLSKAEHDRLPKSPRRPIRCPHCRGLIKVEGMRREAV